MQQAKAMLVENPLVNTSSAMRPYEVLEVEAEEVPQGRILVPADEGAMQSALMNQQVEIGQRDGVQITQQEYLSATFSSGVGSVISDSTTKKVICANYENLDFDVARRLDQVQEEDPYKLASAPPLSVGPAMQPGGGYRVSEYTSMYESHTGETTYQIPEYKSVYDP